VRIVVLGSHVPIGPWRQVWVAKIQTRVRLRDLVVDSRPPRLIVERQPALSNVHMPGHRGLTSARNLSGQILEQNRKNDRHIAVIAESGKSLPRGVSSLDELDIVTLPLGYP